MTSLVIDTANDKSIVALFSGAELIEHVEFETGIQHQNRLEDLVRHLLYRHTIQPHSLAYIAVGIGPGSYTGMRAGVAFAKGLMLGGKIPLVGVASLIGFVPDCSFSGDFAAIVDAKIGGVYALKGTVQNGMADFASPRLMPLEELPAFLKAVGLVVTPSWKEVARRVPAGTSMPEVLERYPSPCALQKEAARLFKEGRYSLDGSIELLYLRKTQAEIEKEACKRGDLTGQ